MADSQFVWDELGTYKAEGRFLDGSKAISQLLGCPWPLMSAVPVLA